MEGAAVVVDDEVALVPVVDIGEGRAGQMAHELVEQSGTGAVRPRFHARKRPPHPVHLLAFAQVKRPVAGRRVGAHHRLRLRAVLFGERLARPAGAHIVLAMARKGRDMQAPQPLRRPLQPRRQRFPGAAAVGIERLPLAPGRRAVGIEERDVGRWAAVALIGMPAAPVGKGRGQAAIGQPRRLRPGGHGEVHWRQVGDANHLRRIGVQQLGPDAGGGIVLHLRPEGARQAQQQADVARDRLHALHHQQAAMAVQGRRQALRPFFGRRRKGIGRFHQAAEGGARQRPHGEGPAAHRRPQGAAGLAAGIGALEWRREAKGCSAMMLTPAEMERLTIYTAAELARKRRARGLKLNHPEALALIADELLEAARDGCTLAEAVALGSALLTADDVLAGVPEMVEMVCVDGQFDDGMKTIVVWQPIRPGREAAGGQPGEILVGEGEIALNAGGEKTTVTVLNTGDRPVHVASHFHFFEVNAALRFDRRAAFGFRLDLPAGASCRFDPGASREVALVAIAGSGEIAGFNRLTEGSIHDPAVKAAALARARQRGFEGA